jgi:uncharacterized peroxidase-related enzyme
MSRIPTPTIDTAPAATRPQLEAVARQLGTVPNLFRIVANSPAALDAYLGFSGGLSKGALSGQTRERIALAVAEANGCDYCLSAHSYLAKNLAKLSDIEIAANRHGHSEDAKADAIVGFALKLLSTRGHVAEGDVATVRAAGASDAEIVEIIGHVALNVFTNTVNSALSTEIDFPVAQPLAA